MWPILFQNLKYLYKIKIKLCNPQKDGFKFYWKTILE